MHTTRGGHQFTRAHLVYWQWLWYSHMEFMKAEDQYVTGFWKTDWIVTLGLFHFIGPANGYTCTLHIHITITRLGGLVCFTRASFVDHVNSWLRQWDPWRPLHLRHGSEIHPSDREMSVNAIQVYLGLWLALLGSITNPNGPNGRFNLPPASHPPPIMCHQWCYSHFEKSCSKSSSVS